MFPSECHWEHGRAVFTIDERHEVALQKLWIVISPSLTASRCEMRYTDIRHALLLKKRKDYGAVRADNC